MAGNSGDAGRSVTSKVIAILLTFANGSAFSLTEIARLAGLPISTAHRLATELVAWGMLERSHEGYYRVGMQLHAIASHASSRPPSIHEYARRVLEDLSAVAGHGTVRLGVLEGLEVAFIEKRAANRPVSMVFEPVTMPAHATAMGKALLAFSPPETVDQVIARGLPRYTAFTVTSPERLRRDLSTTRLTRVAVSRRELDLTRSSAAVPVFGAGGCVVAALELSVCDPHDLRVVQGSLIMAGRGLSRELSGPRPRDYLTIGIERQLDLMINQAVTVDARPP
jgi:DNA-binding IclR family transcriptional regulator